MKHVLAALVLAGALAGCQGIVGTGGNITGFTVPPGCKGQANFSFPMPQGGIMISCDETGAVAAAPVPAPVPSSPAAPHALMMAPRAPVVMLPPSGAHVVISRH